MEAPSPHILCSKGKQPPKTNDDPGPRSSQTAALLVALDSIHAVQCARKHSLGGAAGGRDDPGGV